MNHYDHSPNLLHSPASCAEIVWDVHFGPGLEASNALIRSCDWMDMDARTRLGMYGAPNAHVGAAFAVDYGETVEADGFVLRNSNNRMNNNR